MQHAHPCAASRSSGARRLIHRFVQGASTGLLFVSCALAQGGGRPMPDTSDGIHVFNDQVSPGLTSAQVDFVARHYAGTQKMTRSDADLLRAVNPDFLILHYRLGMGLGYRTITGPCQANGGWFSVIDGTWTQEWPGDNVVQEPWFYHWNNQRVMQCQWGWYLMDTDNANWRRWWSTRVLAQLQHNDDDGLFADSFLVPSFMGGFNPSLPVVDTTFESAWSAKLESFMSYMHDRFAGQYLFIPNVGSWLTTRDHTNFHLADGVFIEGFGYDAWEQYGLEAFTTQSDRLMSLIHDDKVVIGQCYRLDTGAMRMHSLANYLLIKGKHTFLNFEVGQAPEWWPEYDVPIGAPLADAPASTAGLYDAAHGVYTRDYSNGRVYLNPGASAHTIALGSTWYRAQPTGGGDVPSNGVVPSTWRVNYSAVSSITLQPGEGAVLVIDPTPHRVSVPILFAGQPTDITVSGATPNAPQYFFFNRAGEGSTPYPSLNVTLGLAHPRLGAVRTADANGNATWTLTLPSSATGATLSFQVAESGHVTNIARERVH